MEGHCPVPGWAGVPGTDPCYLPPQVRSEGTFPFFYFSFTLPRPPGSETAQQGCSAVRCVPPCSPCDTRRLTSGHICPLQVFDPFPFQTRSLTRAVCGRHCEVGLQSQSSAGDSSGHHGRTSLCLSGTGPGGEDTPAHYMCVLSGHWPVTAHAATTPQHSPSPGASALESTGRPQSQDQCVEGNASGQGNTE